MRNYLTKFKAIDFISHTFHTYITTLSQPYHNFISSQQLQEHISTNSSQLHFNKLFNNFSTNSHNNYSDRSSTNSSYHKLSQYHARVSEDYSSHTFTTHFIDNKHQYSFMWQIFNKLITTLSQTLHRIFQQVSTHLQHIFNTSASCVNKFVNKMNEYRFLLQLIQQTMVQFFNTILFAHSF